MAGQDEPQNRVSKRVSRPSKQRAASSLSERRRSADLSETPTSEHNKRIGSQGAYSDVSSNEVSSITPGTGTSMLSSPRVLVVDDNAVNLQLLTTFMKKTKLPYVAARDGWQALEAFKQAFDDTTQEAFRYVLMDVSMPVMDGLESTREIRRFERSRGVEESRQRSSNSSNSSSSSSEVSGLPLLSSQDDMAGSKDEPETSQRKRKAVIIALTGLANEATQRDAESSGMDCFVAKPVKFKELKKLLR